jgi:hypothetical protein
MSTNLEPIDAVLGGRKHLLPEANALGRDAHVLVAHFVVQQVGEHEFARVFLAARDAIPAIDCRHLLNTFFDVSLPKINSGTHGIRWGWLLFCALNEDSMTAPLSEATPAKKYLKDMMSRT